MSATAVAVPDHLCTRYRLSVDDFQRMGEAGIFDEDTRIELIDGDLITMAPIGSPHGGAVNRITNRLTLAVAGRAIVSTQNPVRLDPFNQPQPDVALLRPRPDFYARSHPGPGDILLLVEIGESSARYDRDKKLPLYASHGIPEVWLVDLPQRTLWRCTGPDAGGYASIAPIGDLAALCLPGIPGCQVDLTGLFD